MASNGQVLRVAKPLAKVRVTEPVVAMEATEDLSQRHAFIPDPKYAKNYVHRKVNGVQDFDLLDYAMSKGHNILLMGDTGAGKTMLPMAYAAQKGLAYYSVPCDVSIDPSALFGKMMPGTEIGKFVWVDGPVTEMVRNGGVLNISEVNFMPARIASSLYPLLDHRRSIQLLGHQGESIRAHPDLLIVADMNPKYRGTQELNLAFANRFPIKVVWGYDPVVEEKLVPSKALLDMVRKIRNEAGIQTPIGTNAMLEFVELFGSLGFKFAKSNFTNGFRDTERGAVDKILDASSVNISNELSKMHQDIDKEIEELNDKGWFDPKSSNPEDFDMEEV
ncbi:MAG TPA: AAA family ATPase [Nitrospira sp.]|nr:AAA family ATPase [Nitrospira sp.]